MKKFIDPEIELVKYEMMDVISTSGLDQGENDFEWNNL